MDKEIILTGQQNEIINHDGAQIVVAGAGTGKTTTLTQYILYLLQEKKYSLKEIVAITFTEKAAGEMREKVYKEIPPAIRDAKDMPELYRLTNLQVDFPAQNRIMTIDAFYASLLSSYPEFSPLPAEYQIIDDYSGFVLETESQQAFFNELSQNENHAELFSDFLNLYDRIGQSRLLNIITDLAKETHEELQRLTVEKTRKEFEADLLSLLMQHGGELWESFLASLPEDIPTELDAPLHDLEAVIKPRGIFGVDGKFNKKSREAYPEFTAALQPKIAATVKALKDHHKIPFMQDPSTPVGNAFEMDWQCHVALRSLARLALIYQEQRQNIVRAQGKARFDDVANAVLEMLLQYPHVLEQVRADIKHILVDEFQDTNQAQWRIIEMLSSGDNLMLVGDPKQSIYGFRGADVAVFETVRKSTFNDDNRRELTSSQRSIPSLVQFYNEAFSEIFPSQQRRDYEAIHQNLKEHREPQTEGGVTWIESTFVEDDVEGEDPPQSLALFLRALQEDVRNIDNGNTESLMPQYKDIVELIAKGETGVIGILCDTHSIKTLFEKALRDHGVEFSSYHGKGFYDSMPVLLAINLARFFYNQNDSLALAGLLRSPLCGFSDDVLLRLSLRNQILWEALGDAASDASLFPDLQDQCKQVKNQLQGWCDAARVLSFSDVLEEVWQGSWLAFYHALDENGEQLDENFGKLIDILRAAQQNSQYGLVEVIEFLQTLREKHSSEAQAELPVSGAVQIMTIHASKGLGFNMTILAHVDRQSRPDSDSVRCEKLRDKSQKYFSIKNLEEGSEDKTYLWNILAHERKAQEQAELKRKLYVACTRAKEHLVIAIPQQSTKSPTMRQLEPLRSLPCYQKFTLQELSNISSRSDEDPQTTRTCSLPDRVEEALTGDALPSEVSVSQLLDQLYPHAEKEIDKWEEYETSDLPIKAKERGSLIHRLLEWDGKSTFTAIENLMRFNNLPVTDSNAMETLARKVREILLKQPFDHKKAKKEVVFSVPASTFRDLLEKTEMNEALTNWYKIDGNWCNGIIDYLVPLQDGGCAILDFKTHWNPAAQHSESTEKRIEMQLRLYAAAARKLGFEVKKLSALRIYGNSGEMQLEEIEESRA